MKQIRDLGITTKEGFSVENLKRFPSMEWGEDGGLQADLFYKGDKIMTVFNAGDGGCAICHTTELYSTKMGEIKTAALAFLKRCDDNWDKYDFLRNKTAKDIDDDDFGSVVTVIEDHYYIVSQLIKSFRNGYKTVVVLKNDLHIDYLQYKVDDVTIDEVKSYLNKNNLDKKYTDFKLFTKNSSLCLL